MLIRKYTKEDISAICELEKTTLGSTLGNDYFLNNLDNKMFCALVVEHDKKIVSYMSTFCDGFIIEVLNICCYKEYRRNKFATKLLNHIISINSTDTISQVFLEVRKDNVDAISFYLKYGFKQINVRKNYYENSVDALVLTYAITNYVMIETSYLSLFTKRYESDNYITYVDDVQKDKYYRNFTYFKDLDINKINSFVENCNEPFFQLVSLSNLKKEQSFKNFVTEEYIILHSFLDNLDLKVDEDCNYQIKVETDALVVEKFLYENSVEYGTSFALLDSNRLVSEFIKGNIVFFTCYKDEEIVGALHTFVYNDSIKIEGVVVKENYRANKVGTTLLNYVYNYYKERNVKQVFLVADALNYAYKWYVKQGYNFIKLYYVYQFVKK